MQTRSNLQVERKITLLWPCSEKAILSHNIHTFDQGHLQQPLGTLAIGNQPNLKRRTQVRRNASMLFVTSRNSYIPQEIRYFNCSTYFTTVRRSSQARCWYIHYNQLQPLVNSLCHHHSRNDGTAHTSNSVES